MKESFSLEEMEQIKLEKQKEGRKIIDHLYKLFTETQFFGFKIKQIENGFCLESEEISYLFENKTNDHVPAKLSVLQKGYPIKTFTRNEILEEKHSNGGLKVSLDEFFVYIGTLIK